MNVCYSLWLLRVTATGHFAQHIARAASLRVASDVLRIVRAYKNRCQSGRDRPIYVRDLACHQCLQDRTWESRMIARQTWLQPRNCNQDCTVSNEVRAAAFHSLELWSRRWFSCIWTDGRHEWHEGFKPQIKERKYDRKCDADIVVSSFFI